MYSSLYGTIFTSPRLRKVYSHQEAQDEKLPEKEHDIPCEGLPRLLAHKPEPKQTPTVVKVLSTYSCIYIAHSAWK